LIKSKSAILFGDNTIARDTKSLRDLVLEEDVENKMDGKCEERRGI
jgi:hypothetical protein